MRVSVVVPVYNTGRYLLDLIGSLRDQTLDPAEFEVLFVDDGSTDDTPTLLAAAAGAPNMRVIRIPNSGWPGRPRNIGLDAARGDYVFLSDHDDRLHPEALQRLTDFAIEHAADVVVGRIVGVGRSAPARIFERTVVDAQRDPALLMTSLTPQKLYRRAFLNEHDIRFPEGRRRLEDHLFVTKAYLRARRVSIYADQPVYYFVLRDDARNASRSAVVWPDYFANAAESVAVVDAEAPDEATRVLLRRRWLRVEAIARLRGPGFLDREDRSALLAAAGAFLRQHYPVAEIDLLPTAERLIGRLLLDGRDDDVVALAAWQRAVVVRLTVVDARLDPSVQQVRVGLRAVAAPTEALPEALRLLPPGYPTGAEVDRLAALPSAARISARFRRRGAAPVELAVQQSVEEGVLTAVSTLELAGVSPLEPGRWNLHAAVRGGGRLRTEAPGAAEGAVAGAAIRVAGHRFRLSPGQRSPLVLTVERTGALSAARRVAARIARRLRRVTRAAR